MVNLRDWGIPLGWRFRALKLWFVLSSNGAETPLTMVREHLRAGKLFARWVEEEPGFELLAPSRLGLVCFRHRPAGITDEATLTEHHRELLKRVNSSGHLFLTHTVLRGRFCLRLALGQRTTTERNVREAMEELLKVATRKS